MKHQRIKKIRRLRLLYTDVQIEELKKDLKVVIDKYYEKINKNINWSSTELEKLNIIKTTRKPHNNRWVDNIKTCQCGIKFIRYGKHNCLQK